MDELTVELIEAETDEEAAPYAQSGVIPDNCEVIMGGDSSSPTWEQYHGQFNENFRPRIVAIRALIERQDLVGRCGDEICNTHYFRFSDGVCVSFTWRAWGDLMQAIVGKREGYMTYYMGCLRDRKALEGGS